MKMETYGAAEMALLLAASRGDPSRESVRRLMSRELDWTQLTRLAVESHATVGLWQVISSFPDLPSESGRLQALAVVNDFRRYHIRSLVARVSAELAAAGIEVLPLKGAALLAGGVMRPTPRTMSDIDLLVVKGSPEKAWQICKSNGWTLVDEELSEAVYSAHHHLPPLQDPDGINVGLELHRTLMPGVDLLGIDVGAFVKRSRVVRVGETRVRVPSVEDLLLHLCLHFAWSDKLRRGAWRTYADAHAILSDPSFEWDRFLATTSSRRARKCVYWTLRLGRVVADVSVPLAVLRALDPTEGGRFAGILERHFATQIGEGTHDDSIAERVQEWLWLEALGEHPGGRTADQLWNLGSLDVPRSHDGAARPTRNAFTAAFRTWIYFKRLVTRA